ADQWIRLCAARGDWTCARRLDRLLDRGELGRQALIAYLEVLSEKRKGKWWAVRRLVHRHRDRLRQDVHGWGAVGYVLTNTADWRKAAEWLADWPERPGVEPWMLINLVIALRSLGRDAEANRVSQHAVTLPEGPTSRHHTLWLGLDAAL